MKILCIALAAVLIAVLGYVAYVFLAYHRLGDIPLEVQGNGSLEAKAGEEYRIVSWNIGFGAYEADYGFFMDGGTESWARSPEKLDANLRNIAAKLSSFDADFVLVQEIDSDSTRSYHMDERAYLRDVLPGETYASVFAQNYDSPFLLYPFHQPHGASRSGIMTFSKAGIVSSRRVELPVEGGFMKILDLDRCYSVSRIPTADGHTLVLYNLHLSAYTSDGTIATEQLKLLLADMQSEFEAGNYCIAGGDFNKDLLGDSSVYFGAADQEYSWAQPIPAETFDGFDITLVAPLDEDDPVPSCRNADGPYHEGQYVLTVDGFLVSPNVEVLESQVLDEAFRCSDHNPVYMDFILS